MADFWGDALNALKNAWDTFLGNGSQQQQNTQQGRGSAARQADDKAARARAREQYAGQSASSAFEDLMSRLNGVQPQQQEEQPFGQLFSGFGQYTPNYNAEEQQAIEQRAAQAAREASYENAPRNQAKGQAPEETEPTSIYNATPLQLFGMENGGSLFAPQFQRAANDSVFKQSMEQQREQLAQQPEPETTDDLGTWLSSIFDVGNRSNDLNQEAQGWGDLYQSTRDQNVAETNRLQENGSPAGVEALRNGIEGILNHFPMSDAARARDDMESQNVPHSSQDLVDENNNKLEVLPDNQLESNMAVLREANPDFQPYQNMADWQTNGTRDEWHTVMFDPRLVERFANSFTYYTPNEEDRTYLEQNLTNLANDPRAMELAEAAFNSMWDTQKAYDYEQFYSGTGPDYDVQRYNLIFDPLNGMIGMNDWATSQGLAPSVAFPGPEDPNQKIASLSTLGDLYVEYLRNGAGLTQRGEYDDPTKLFMQPFIQSTQEQAERGDTALDADEQLALNYALNNYVLGLRALDNSDNQAAARLAGTNQDWLDTTFALDPHRFVSQKDLNSPDMQNKLSNHQIWQIQPGESFQEQNPTYGNKDYAGEYSIGDNYTDLDAIRRYNVPVMGADQLLANLGYYMADKDAF